MRGQGGAEVFGFENKLLALHVLKLQLSFRIVKMSHLLNFSLSCSDNLPRYKPCCVVMWCEFFPSIDLVPLYIHLLQVAEKILNNKELEFYKWEGDLSQLLENVREKLNKVTEVSHCVSSYGVDLLFSFVSSTIFH